MNSPSHADCPLPDTMPVMVLSDCYLFPGCLLPLYIFEERYRLMLSHALGSARRFCSGTRLRGAADGILPVSTAGLVSACKKQEDGTSHVLLQGLRRIRFTGWEQQKPFLIARIEPLPTVVATDAGHTDQLKRQALGLLPEDRSECGEGMRALRTALDDMPCPERVCDILAYHFVRRAPALTALLTEPVLERRYETLIGELRQRRTRD